jgi:3-dehydroquinate dehydratase
MSTILKKYNTTVYIPFGDLSSVIKWCQHNVQSDWTYSVLNEVSKAPGVYEFHFDDEKDYIAFLLAIK